MIRSKYTTGHKYRQITKSHKKELITLSIQIYTESSLKDSRIFQTFNKSNPNKTVEQKAISLIKNSKHLTNEDIESAYIAVRQITDSLTREAMKAFDEEKVVLVYNSDSRKSMSQAVPFLTFKNKSSGKYVTYFFVDKYVSLSRDGVLTIQPTVLRDILISGAISNGIKRNYGNLATNEYLQKILMVIYTKLFTRILNREFSIMGKKVEFDTITFWINKYFLINLFGSSLSDEAANNLASFDLKHVDELQLEEIERLYDEFDPHNIEDLLNLLKTISPRMKTLTLGVFLSDWINYYYAPSMLAIDNIEYLIFMINALLSGNASLVNISACDIVKDTKNIKSIRSELLKLTK